MVSYSTDNMSHDLKALHELAPGLLFHLYLSTPPITHSSLVTSSLRPFVTLSSRPPSGPCTSSSLSLQHSSLRSQLNDNPLGVSLSNKEPSCLILSWFLKLRVIISFCNYVTSFFLLRFVCLINL